MAYDLQDYVQQTKAVADAGRLLQNFLGGEEDARDEAVKQLAEAAEQQTKQGAGYRAFMFSEMKQAPTDKGVGARATEEVLAGALGEMRVADVLIAAGRAVGETGEPPQPHLLDEALNRLEDTTQTFKQALVGAQAADAKAAGHLAFVESAAAAAVVKSADLDHAKSAYREQSAAALQTVVDESRGVVASVIETLKGSEIGGKVTEALSALGNKLLDLPQLEALGKLVRQGLEKLNNAIDALLNLVGNDALKRVKEKLAELWEKFSGGKDVLTQVLEHLFGVTATEAKIKEVCELQGLILGTVDQGSTDLQELAARYKGQMKLAKGIAGGLAIVAPAVVWLSGANPGVVLAVAFASVLMIAVVLLLGMDYADSGRILQRVRGVGEITESLRPAV
ncbi:MAG: hypothetical protein DMF64_15665 [Acidobacteria bacterium]|nr:MAG: hypothetical protein DMF64_15665 [Acidobacteriota bacterium]